MEFGDRWAQPNRPRRIGAQLNSEVCPLPILSATNRQYFVKGGIDQSEAGCGKDSVKMTTLRTEKNQLGPAFRSVFGSSRRRPVLAPRPLQGVWISWPDLGADRGW